jgi:hypothetical protein
MELPKAVETPQAVDIQVDIQVDINDDLPPTEPQQIETKTADVTAEKLDLDAQLAMYSRDGSRVVIPGDESPNKNPKTDAESNQKQDSIGGAFLTPQNEAAKPTPITDISIDKGFPMTDSIKIRDGVRQGTLQSMLDDIGDPSSPLKAPLSDSPQKSNPNPHSTQETPSESKRYSIIVRNESGAPHDNFPIIDQKESQFTTNKTQIPERAPTLDSNNSKSENNKFQELPQPKKPDTRDLATMLQSYEAKSTQPTPPNPNPNPNPKNQDPKNQENSFNISNTQDETHQKTATEFLNPFDSNTNALIEINTVDLTSQSEKRAGN